MYEAQFQNKQIIYPDLDVSSQCVFLVFSPNIVKFFAFQLLDISRENHTDFRSLLDYDGDVVTTVISENNPENIERSYTHF